MNTIAGVATKAHEGSCGPCVLCKKYSHPNKMDPRVSQLISSLEGPINPAACIWHACYKLAARNVGNSNQPRWRPKSVVATEHCGVEKCPNSVYRHTTIASPIQIEVKKLTTFSIADTVNTPLCQSHYNVVYSYLHSPMECDSCKARPKRGKQHSRHCPVPDTINTYLNHISNEPSTLTDLSRICNSCYHFFNQTLKQLQQAKSLVEEIEEQEHLLNIDSVCKVLSDKLLLYHSKIP